MINEKEVAAAFVIPKPTCFFLLSFVAFLRRVRMRARDWSGIFQMRIKETVADFFAHADDENCIDHATVTFPRSELTTSFLFQN